MALYKLNRFRRSKNCLKYIMPFGRIVTYENIAVVINKDGSVQTSLRYRGPDLASAIKEQLAIITSQLNMVFSAMDTGYVIYFEAQRSPSNNYDEDVFFTDRVTKIIDNERKALFSANRYFESDYYMTVYYLPPTDNEDKLKDIVIEGKKKREIAAEETLEKFCGETDKIFRIFHSLNIPVQYLNDDDMLTYLHSVISGDGRRLKMPDKPLLLDSFLYDTPLYGGLEPRIGKKHIRVIVPLKFLSSTVFGLFDSLNQIDFSYRWVTRFYCLSKPDSISSLDEIKRGWNGKLKSLIAMFKELIADRESDENINVSAKMKLDETKDAITAVENDITSYGYYSTAVIVADESEEEAEEKAKHVCQTFVNLGFEAKIETINAIDAFLGCVPGNVGHNIRRPMLSCGNLVHMIPLSDIWAGPARNKHLKAPPLLYTRTVGNTPFRLNLHIGDVGHTLIVGPTGAGKSVHLNMIAASFRKYKDAQVYIFDKGASSRVLTEGVGGNFYDLGNEINEMSFQPLAAIDDEKERQWVLDWLCDYVRQENVAITPELKKYLWEALCVVASYPKNLRRISSLINSVHSHELQMALSPLSASGAYGNIFDSDEDKLSFSSWQAFEMEKLMQTPSVVGPAIMYIFHRIEQQLCGKPTIIMLDECWVFLDNQTFANKIREWLKVLRKANASVVFATQSLDDIAQSRIFSTILESCPSKIFLPNARALQKEAKENYKSFGLNDRQIEIIAAAVPKKEYYYVSPDGCRLYDLSLEECPVSLAFTAINKADQKRCQEIIDEYGHENFSLEWLRYKNLLKDGDEEDDR
jgi:type IV secretion system protein VirB4